VADGVGPEEELQRELTLLRIAIVKRLRAELAKPDASASAPFLDVARKTVESFMIAPEARPAPPIVTDLPFPEPE